MRYVVGLGAIVVIGLVAWAFPPTGPAHDPLVSHGYLGFIASWMLFTIPLALTLGTLGGVWLLFCSGVAKIEKARQKKTPKSIAISYSPHTRAFPAQAALPAPQPAIDVTPARSLPPSTLDLVTLLGRGQPSLDNVLIATDDTGHAYRLPAHALCHVALAGPTGAGKSNILRLLLAQVLASGAKVVLIDPKFTPWDPKSGEDWRPIAQRLHLPPAYKPGDIQRVIRWIDDELERRLELRRAGRDWGDPLFVASGELGTVAEDVPDAMPILARVGKLGRAVDMLQIVASHDFLVSTTKQPGAARENYRTAYYLGGDQRTGQVLLDWQGRIDEGQLMPGVAYLRSQATPQAQVVRVPKASNEAIYRLLGGFSAAPLRLQDRAVVATDVATRSQHVANPQAVEAARLFLDGCEPAEVVYTLRGIKSNEGGRYQTALKEINALIREGVQKGV